MTRTKGLPGRSPPSRFASAAFSLPAFVLVASAASPVASAQPKLLPEEPEDDQRLRGSASGSGNGTAEASKAPPLPPSRSNPAVLEVTLAWPLQFIGTSNNQGKATSYSLLGYGFDAALCLAPSACLAAEAASNLNASSGSRLLSGVSLGGQYFFLGRADPEPQKGRDAPGANSSLRSIWRAWGSGAFCQKDYDFRSLYGEDSDQVYIGGRPQLEGSFWCAQGELGIDHLFRSGHRLGLGASFFRSLKGSQAGFAVSGYAVKVKYQLLRF